MSNDIPLEVKTEILMRLNDLHRELDLNRFDINHVISVCKNMGYVLEINYNPLFEYDGGKVEVIRLESVDQYLDYVYFNAKDGFSDPNFDVYYTDWDTHDVADYNFADIDELFKD